MREAASIKSEKPNWLGKIPNDWKVKRIKYFTQSRKEKSEDGSETLLSVSEHTGIVPRKNIREGEEHLSRSESLEGYLKVHIGDLVNNIMLMWKRGLGVSGYNGIVSPAYSVFSFIEAEPRYFHYLFRTDQYISEFRRNSTGVIDSRLRLYDESFGRISAHFPPLPEQQAIVSFLDNKTEKIDKLIQLKERKIELLKEKRAALINDMVTGKKVWDGKEWVKPTETKDSGVEWIGEIPIDWRVKKFRHCFNIKGGGTPSKDKPEYWNGNIPWVSPKDMKSDVISSSIDYITEHALNDSATNLIDSGSLLMVVRSGILQHTIPVGITSVPLTINQDIKAIMPKGEDLVSFLRFYIKGNNHILLQEWTKEGATVESVEMEFMLDSKIPFPPANLQELIVTFIEKEVSSIDHSIQYETNKISLLKDYRQSLISEVVTGKIRVVDQDLSMTSQTQMN